MNMKASDDYKHKRTLAYLLDRRQIPVIVNYYKERGIEFRDDLFSLQELVQWIWRSSIRQAQPLPINLYIPSERMRTILVNWIKHSDAAIVQGTRLDTAAVGNDDDESEPTRATADLPERVEGTESILVRDLPTYAYRPAQFLGLHGQGQDSEGASVRRMANPAWQSEGAEANAGT
jgi:hypothetical protein